jgi:hypothetical protein
MPAGKGVGIRARADIQIGQPDWPALGPPPDAVSLVHLNSPILGKIGILRTVNGFAG